MFITNFTPSVNRAGIMGIIVLSSNLLYRKNDSINSISISLLLSLIINPFIIHDIGFKLSYLGSIGIILFSKNIENILSRRINKKISKILSVTFSAQIMIMPITAYMFNTVSLTFLISSFLATLLLGVIIFLGFITIIISFISFKLAKLLAVVLNLLLQLLSVLTRLISKIPFGNILVVTPYLISIISIYLMALILNYLYTIFTFKKSLRRIEKKILNSIKSKKIMKYIVFCFVTIIIFNFIYFILTPKELEIHFIDVSQGDSTLIITPQNKKILIDGGEENNNLVVSYLLDRRIKVLDCIIISHFDDDHVRSEF